MEERLQRHDRNEEHLGELAFRHRVPELVLFVVLLLGGLTPRVGVAYAVQRSSF